MKRITTALTALFLLVAAFTASGQQVNSVTHSPNPAYSGNDVNLNIDITLWPHYYLNGSYVSWVGNYAYVYLDFDYNPPTPWMPGIAVSINYNVDLGTLYSGNYTVRVLDFDNGTLLYNYNFSVLSACNPPVLSQLSVSNLMCTSATLQCNVGGVSAYGFRYKAANSSTWTTVNSTPNNYLNIVNLVVNNQYEFQSRVWCGSSASAWSPSKYFLSCQNGGTGTCSNPYVAFCGNTYTGSNAAGANSYTAYSGAGVNFTQMYGPEVFYQITLTQSGPLSLSLTGLTPGQDLDLILLSSCNSNSIVAYSGNSSNTSEYINIGYLAAGTYRIAIDGWNYAVSNYVLTVQCNSYACQAPSPGQLFATNIAASSARIYCNYPGASAFDWRYRVVGSLNWIDLPVSSSNFTDLFSLNSNTTYEFQCTVFCSGAWTLWSSSQYFTTSSYNYVINDEHCKAIELMPNSLCYQISGSNYGATTSLYPSAPTECNTAGMLDVWYKVQLPYTGKVKIYTFAGTMTDAVVAFYYGGCNKLNAGNPTCFDVTNGDEMPDVTLNGTAGEWWYIRIWGYGGTAGTFSICAQTVVNLVADENTVSKEGSTDDRDDASHVVTEKKNTPDPGGTALKLTLFPMPAHDFVNYSIELDKDSELQIQVFDLNGRLVKEVVGLSGTTGAFSERLEITDLPPGLYVVRMNVDGKELTGKLMKQ